MTSEVIKKQNDTEDYQREMYLKFSLQFIRELRLKLQTNSAGCNLWKTIKNYVTIFYRDNKPHFVLCVCMCGRAHAMALVCERVSEIDLHKNQFSPAWVRHKLYIMARPCIIVFSLHVVQSGVNHRVRWFDVPLPTLIVSASRTDGKTTTLSAINIQYKRTYALRNNFLGVEEKTQEVVINNDV